MLSVIGVNYNSAPLLKECFSSIQSASGDVEFIAVDSGSHQDDVNNLLTLKEKGAEILLNRENIGYAAAVNQGLSKAGGDFILITNPDVLYSPGSIQSMMQSCAQLPRCGAVGPKTWWNRKMTFLLPLSEIITPWRNAMGEYARGSRGLYARILRSWIKRNVRYWQAEVPMEQEMLSGASIMTTKKIIDAVGGFDGAFPLYFEDADWCLRTRKAGFMLYTEPAAAIVHYYNQSAKQDTGAAGGKFAYSLSRFFSKHYTVQAAVMKRLLQLTHQARNHGVFSFEDIGTHTQPPAFQFSAHSQKLILLSPVDSLIPSAGSFFEDNAFSMPEDLWSHLGDGRYFVKAFDLDGLKECGSWTWTRRSA